MEDLVQVADRFQKFCDQRNWRFCFIGGLALMHWGEPRLTQDIDLCLLTGFGREDEYVDAILEHYQERITDARTFAIQNRVLLISSTDNVPLDISLGGIPFEERVISRSLQVSYSDGVNLRICSAEDLVTLKCFADRARDWADVEGILRRRAEQLDWSLIDQELQELRELKGASDSVEKLAQLRKRFLPN